MDDNVYFEHEAEQAVHQTTLHWQAYFEELAEQIARRRSQVREGPAVVKIEDVQQARQLFEATLRQLFDRPNH